MKRKETRRSVRMGDQIMREVANMLSEEMADPRLAQVTISGVRMNADLRIAEIFYTLSGDEDTLAAAQKALEKAKGFLRSGLGRRLKLKYQPDLRFTRDTFLEDMVYAKGSSGDLPDIT